MLTGIGGGIARDILVNEIPTVLVADLYAVAALSGAAIVVGGTLLKLPSGLATAVGLFLCFGLRLVAIRRGWHLPMAHWPQEAQRRVVAAQVHRDGERRDGEPGKPAEK